MEVRRSAEPPTFDFEIKDHIELLNARGWLDVDRAGRLAGSRSYVLKGEAVLLEFALVQWTMAKLVARGFQPVLWTTIHHSAVGRPLAAASWASE